MTEIRALSAPLQLKHLNLNIFFRLERNAESYLDCEKKKIIIIPESLSPPAQAAELKVCFVFVERCVCV